MSPLSFFITSLTLILTKISAPSFSALCANHLNVFLTSKTAALGIESLIVISLFGEQNEKFLIGYYQARATTKEWLSDLIVCTVLVWLVFLVIQIE